MRVNSTCRQDHLFARNHFGSYSRNDDEIPNPKKTQSKRALE